MRNVSVVFLARENLPLVADVVLRAVDSLETSAPRMR